MIFIAIALTAITSVIVTVCAYLFIPFKYIQALYSARLETSWRDLWALQSNLAKILIRAEIPVFTANELAAMFLDVYLKADPWEWEYFRQFMKDSEEMHIKASVKK